MKKLLLLSFVAAALLLSGLPKATVFAAPETSCDPAKKILCFCAGESPTGAQVGFLESQATISDCKASCSILTVPAKLADATFKFQCTPITGGEPFIPDGGDGYVVARAADAVPKEETVPKKDPVIPNLNVQIPGLDFANSVQINPETGVVTSNLLGLYVAAIYRYLLGAGALIAVTMLMVGGVQYATARGESKAVSQGKERITNAIIGLVLLFLAFDIAFFIDPGTVAFKSLKFKSIPEKLLSEDTTGNEGEGSTPSGNSLKDIPSPYKEIIAAAKDAKACHMTQGIASPTGRLPNLGKHHWYDRGVNGDWEKVHAMDWAAGWGTEILAPFDGVVSYTKQTNTDNLCGNRIYLSGSGVKITICHAKDFLRKDGLMFEGSVKQGEVIGHVGGRCCIGGGPVPDGWVTQCNVSGTSCDDPNVNNPSCTCQPITQSGNTTNPHVHITMNSGGNILACLE